MMPGLTAVAFSDLAGWEDDDPSGLLGPIHRCLDHMRSVKPYRTGDLGIASAELEAAFAAAAETDFADAASARRYFETQFRCFRVDPGPVRRGQVTAFYEPEVEVSDTRDETWRFPFYRRPDDLVDLDDQNRPADLDRSYMFGRLRDGVIAAYPDRQAIDEGYLEDRGLEIAWAKSRVDVFFAHIQGAARLRYPDGRMIRVTYAAKAGHPFTGIGRHLLDSGELAPGTVSMGSIRAWLAAHPDRVSEILWTNRSYIFFREAEVTDPRLGPVAAAKVALEPMRSIAVDRQIHTFSSPFFIRSERLTSLTEGRPFARLMLALDTGTAIVGPARADIFTGSGPAAGDLAGDVNAEAEFYLLVPKDAAGRYGR